MAKHLNNPKAATPAEPDAKPSSDPSAASTRENLNTTFGSPNEDK